MNTSNAQALTEARRTPASLPPFPHTGHHLALAKWEHDVGIRRFDNIPAVIFEENPKKNKSARRVVEHQLRRPSQRDETHSVGLRRSGGIGRDGDGNEAMDFASYFARRADRVAELLTAADDEVFGDAAAAPPPTTTTTSPARREEWGRSEPHASEWSRATRVRVRGRAIALPERASPPRGDGTPETPLSSIDGSGGDEDGVVERLVRALTDEIMQCEVEEELAPLIAAIRGEAAENS